MARSYCQITLSSSDADQSPSLRVSSAPAVGPRIRPHAMKLWTERWQPMPLPSLYPRASTSNKPTGLPGFGKPTLISNYSSRAALTPLAQRTCRGITWASPCICRPTAELPCPTQVWARPLTKAANSAGGAPSVGEHTSAPSTPSSMPPPPMPNTGYRQTKRSHLGHRTGADTRPDSRPG